MKAGPTVDPKNVLNLYPQLAGLPADQVANLRIESRRRLVKHDELGDVDHGPVGQLGRGQAQLLQVPRPGPPGPGPIGRDVHMITGEEAIALHATHRVEDRRAIHHREDDVLEGHVQLVDVGGIEVLTAAGGRDVLERGFEV